MNRRSQIHEERERTYLYLPNTAGVRHILEQLDAAHDALDEECELCKRNRAEPGD